ncbi:MAG: hypothetical protein LBJ12_09390 [Oscillospiraceae bacterium]|jgi:putative flippase GtrA|nr:hypothetical protein [Oscillospiraceae bacterium]
MSDTEKSLRTKLFNYKTILYIVFGIVTTVVNFGFYWGCAKALYRVWPAGRFAFCARRWKT